jgi:hypothetical protein
MQTLHSDWFSVEADCATEKKVLFQLLIKYFKWDDWIRVRCISREWLKLSMSQWHENYDFHHLSDWRKQQMSEIEKYRLATMTPERKCSLLDSLLQPYRTHQYELELICNLFSIESRSKQSFEIINLSAIQCFPSITQKLMEHGYRMRHDVWILLFLKTTNPPTQFLDFLCSMLVSSSPPSHSHTEVVKRILQICRNNNCTVVRNIAEKLNLQPVLDEISIEEALNTVNKLIYHQNTPENKAWLLLSLVGRSRATFEPATPVRHKLISHADDLHRSVPYLSTVEKCVECVNFLCRLFSWDVPSTGMGDQLALLPYFQELYLHAISLGGADANLQRLFQTSSFFAWCLWEQFNQNKAMDMCCNLQFFGADLSSLSWGHSSDIHNFTTNHQQEHQTHAVANSNTNEKVEKPRMSTPLFEHLIFSKENLHSVLTNNETTDAWFWHQLKKLPIPSLARLLVHLSMPVLNLARNNDKFLYQVGTKSYSNFLQRVCTETSLHTVDDILKVLRSHMPPLAPEILTECHFHFVRLAVAHKSFTSCSNATAASTLLSTTTSSTNTINTDMKEKYIMENFFIDDNFDEPEIDDDDDDDDNDDDNDEIIVDEKEEEKDKIKKSRLK